MEHNKFRQEALEMGTNPFAYQDIMLYGFVASALKLGCSCKMLDFNFFRLQSVHLLLSNNESKFIVLLTFPDVLTSINLLTLACCDFGSSGY
jgi:hypothetical protein